LSKNPVSVIDSFRLIFPESDPNAADAYGKLIAPMFDFEVPEYARALPFSAETEVYCLPDVTVSNVRTTASLLTRTVKTIARSASDEILVVCYPRGHFTYQIGGTERRVESGEVAIFDLAQEMVIEAPYVENISLAISRRRLEPIVPLLDSAHGAVTPATALAKVLIGVMQQVINAGASIQASEAGPIADTLVRLVGSCIGLMSRQKLAAGTSSATISLASLKAAIERQLTNPDFGPQSLLNEFGITRSTLYRLFEPLGGVSAFINERRLRYAFRQMTDPALHDLRLSQLAFDLGFAHASAFSRAFKAQFGMTPKEVRTLTVRPEGKDVPYTVSPAAFPYIRPPDP
jgi:AraC-like DNA-binding protein